MKNSKFIASLSIVGITGLVLGYFYAKTPEASYEFELEKNVESSQYAKSSITSLERSLDTKKSNQDIAINKPNEDDNLSLKSEPEPKVTRLPANSETPLSSTESNTIEKSESDFKAWKADSKSRVVQEMEVILPDSIRDSFLRKVDTPDYFSDISSLSEEQLSSSDIDMATYIRDFISVHQFGNQAEIFELDCAHLTCRLFGRASDPVKWQQVYVELIFSFSSIGLVQNENNNKTGVTFVDPDSNNAFFYHQISMKKQ